MNGIKGVPILRAVYRYYHELTRPAPLQEFDDYDDYWKSRVKEGKRLSFLDRHEIISNAIPEGFSVLDIGCGDGAFLRYIRSRHPNSEILGVDISRVAVDELHASGVAAKVIDIESPLSAQISGHWDVVVLMEVIEHVADAEALIKQVMEMNPKRIFVTIPNCGFLLHRLRLMFGGRFPITAIVYHMKEHVRFWTVKDFYEWAAACGLHVHSHKGQVFRRDKALVWLVRTFPALFADRMVYELSISSNDGPE
jgi:methionine biosynthesis protein MetW